MPTHEPPQRSDSSIYLAFDCCACQTHSHRPCFTKSGFQFERCEGCGLIRINPQPDAATLARIYSSDYFNAWGARSVPAKVESLKWNTLLHHVIRPAALPRGSRILDCGAALGTLMRAAERDGLVAHGVELIQSAAERLQEEFGPSRVFAGEFELAEFDSGMAPPFDAVFMCDFIEHVRQPDKVVAKAARLVRSGGSLVITTPDAGSFSRRLMGSSWPHFNAQHLYSFTPSNLALLLSKHGFEVLNSRPAVKEMSLEMLSTMLSISKPWWAPAVSLVARLAGKRLRQHPWRLPLGQFFLLARRR